MEGQKMNIHVRGLDAIIHLRDCHLGPLVSTSFDLAFGEMDPPRASAMGDGDWSNGLIKELQGEDTFVPVLERIFCDALGNISQEFCLGGPFQNQRFLIDGGHDDCLKEINTVGGR